MEKQHASSISRRTLLRSSGAGFGYLALSALLGQQALKADESITPTDRALGPPLPHFKPKAKRIIFVFMEGAISQHDTFEYKPELQENDGKRGPYGGTLAASKFKFKQHGQTGTWSSALLLNIATHSDKL